MEIREIDVEGYERVAHCRDSRTGLNAIIAIHDTTLGPALGGCRLWPYNEHAALTDVLRLARGMTYKAAMADLPHGGGKAVIIDAGYHHKPDTLLRAFGRFVNHFEGSYITGQDVGMEPRDMRVVAEETSYVETSTDEDTGSLMTAIGVLYGVRTALRHRTSSRDLTGKRVAVQGLGHVGYELCWLLHDSGARLVVADIDRAKVTHAVEEFGADAVVPDAIYDEHANVFCPCALGGVLNVDTIPRLRAPIVVGAANNQLAEPEDGLALYRRGILYAPDYVASAGGIIDAAWGRAHPGEPRDAEVIEDQVARIKRRLDTIFDRSAHLCRPTNEITDEIVEERLRTAKRVKHTNARLREANQAMIARRLGNRALEGRAY